MGKGAFHQASNASLPALLLAALLLRLRPS